MDAVAYVLTFADFADKAIGPNRHIFALWEGLVFMGLVVWWLLDNQRASASVEAENKRLTESSPRIVYLGSRGSLLIVNLAGGQSVDYFLVHLRFRNRPITRIGDRSAAKNVSATVQIWEHNRATKLREFEGRWAMTLAGDYVGFSSTQPMIDFDANEVDRKLNLVVLPSVVPFICAASEENLSTFADGAHPSYRLPIESAYDVNVKLRANNVDQDYWFKLERVDEVMNPLKVTPVNGEIDLSS